MANANNIGAKQSRQVCGFGDRNPPDCDVERSLAVRIELMRRPAWSRQLAIFLARFQSRRSRYGLGRPLADSHKLLAKRNVERNASLRPEEIPRV